MSAEAEPNARTIKVASTASSTPLPRSWVPYGDSPYWLGERIASGGMGTVHLGLKQGALGFRRLLAIKRLHGHLAQDPDFVARFKDEIRLVSRLNHPNVVQTLDVLESDEEIALVMEFVEGITLYQLQRDAHEGGQEIPIQVVVGIIVQVLHGLHSAHELCDDEGHPLHLVHRDVSPQNIMIARDGLVKVLDFGVAKAASETHVTRTGQLSGKAAYMSPEQAIGQTVDRRTDVFAAGVVLWEAVTGQRLFRSPGTPESAALKNVLEKRVPPPTEVRADVSPALERIMLRALERDPTRRFGSARDFALALEEAVPHASLSVVASGVVQISPNHFAGRPASLPMDVAAGNGRGSDGRGAVEPWRRYLETVRPQLSATVHDVTRPIEGVAVERPSHGGTSRRSTWLYVLGAAALLAGSAWVGVGLLREPPPTSIVSASGSGILSDARPEPRQLMVATHASYGLGTAPPSSMQPGAVQSGGVPSSVTALGSGAREVNTKNSSALATPVTNPAAVTPVSPLTPERLPTISPVRTKSRVQQKRIKAETPEVSKGKSSNCSPPTYTDADGIRHFKPECL